MNLGTPPKACKHDGEFIQNPNTRLWQCCGCYVELTAGELINLQKLVILERKLNSIIKFTVPPVEFPLPTKGG